MNIIAAIRRRIRILRINDTAYQLRWIHQSYHERARGLRRDLVQLEREHLADIAAQGPTSREIARGVEARAKQPLFS